MNQPQLIDCPNCKNRIFYDSKICPYCKLNLNKSKPSFDEEIYNFLYQEYSTTKNKPAAIKKGMEKYNKNMNEIKEIIDYISDEIYNKELAEKKAIPKEELPNNGIYYSKNKYTKSFLFNTSKRKIPPIKIISVIIYWIIILFIYSKTKNPTLQMGLFIGFLIGVVFFAHTIIKYSKMPPTPHTYTFSLLQYFLHNLIYKIILMISLVLILLKLDFGMYISLIIIITLITLFFTFLYQLLKKSTERFTVEYGLIQYQHERREFFWWDGNNDVNSVHESSYFTVVYYDIKSIKKVKETFNNIIIYADIEKNIHMNQPGRTIKRKPKKMEKLKLSKSFINNKNLVKSLKMCIKNSEN